MFTVIVVVTLGWGWRIRTVAVAGGSFVPDGVVRDAILAMLEERWGSIIPRSSVVYIGTTRIAAVLRERYAFAAVTIKRRWWDRTLAVTITEHPVAAVARFPSGEGVVLRSDGRIIGHLSVSATPPGGDARIPARIPPHTLRFQWEGTIPPIGGALLDDAALSALTLFWGELRQAGGVLAPETIARLPGTEQSFSVRTTGGQTIIVSAEEPAVQREKLRTFLRDRSTTAQRAALHTVDLRYGDRVYVQ